MQMIRKYSKTLFGCYCVLMLWLLYGQRMGDSVYTTVNLDPLKTINSYVTVLLRTNDPALIRHIIINLAGNVIMFIPLGFFLPMIWKCFSGFFSHLLGSALIIVLIELVQYITSLGSLDIDDLILNLPGTIIGYFLWSLFARGRK